MINVQELPAVQMLLSTSALAVETQAATIEYVRAPLGSGSHSCGLAEVRSTKRLVVAPQALPVSLAAAVTAARADGAGIDAEIELDVRGIAGQVEHELQRALVEQAWRVTLDAFPGAITLPMAAPLIAIDHVKFYGADGVQRTLDPQDYLVDDVSEPGYVLTAPGRAWPATAARVNAVEVQYRCGYGTDHSAVPPAIQSYILGRIAAKHAPTESRNEKFLDDLLDGFKVYGS